LTPLTRLGNPLHSSPPWGLARVFSQEDSAVWFGKKDVGLGTFGSFPLQDFGGRQPAALFGFIPFSLPIVRFRRRPRSHFTLVFSQGCKFSHVPCPVFSPSMFKVEPWAFRAAGTTVCFPLSLLTLIKRFFLSQPLLTDFLFFFFSRGRSASPIRLSAIMQFLAVGSLGGVLFFPLFFSAFSLAPGLSVDYPY